MIACYVILFSSLPGRPCKEEDLSHFVVRGIVCVCISVAQFAKLVSISDTMLPYTQASQGVVTYMSSCVEACAAGVKIESSDQNQLGEGFGGCNH